MNPCDNSDNVLCSSYPLFDQFSKIHELFSEDLINSNLVTRKMYMKKRGPSCTNDHHWRHVRKTLYLMLECDHTVHMLSLFFLSRALFWSIFREKFNHIPNTRTVNNPHRNPSWNSRRKVCVHLLIPLKRVETTLHKHVQLNQFYFSIFIATVKIPLNFLVQWIKRIVSLKREVCKLFRRRLSERLLL